MNEFCAKKLGEVLAFASVSLDTAKQGNKAMTVILGDSGLADFIDNNEKQIETINQIAAEYEVTDIVNKKLAGTGEKLKKMRDLYIGDEWDNPTELLEWSGFFEGAAIVHWQLVIGISRGLSNNTIDDLAQKTLTFRKALFTLVEKKLNEFGEAKSQL